MRRSLWCFCFNGSRAHNTRGRPSPPPSLTSMKTNGRRNASAAIAVALCVLVVRTVAHVSDCPDSNPLAFWKSGGVQLPVEYERTGVVPAGSTCSVVGYGFNGRSATFDAKDVLAGGYLGGPEFVVHVTPSNETDEGEGGEEPRCFEWETGEDFDVYSVLVTTTASMPNGTAANASVFSPGVSYRYAPAARLGGRICVGTEATDPAVVTFCFVPAAAVFDVTVEHAATYDVAWQFELVPATAQAVICAGSADACPVRLTARATASPLVIVARSVSGAFRIANAWDGEAGSLLPRIWAVDATGQGTELAVACGNELDFASCVFGGTVDPTSSPANVVAVLDSGIVGVQPGVACAAVPAEVRVVRGKDYVVELPQGGAARAGVVGESGEVIEYRVVAWMRPDIPSAEWTASLSYATDDRVVVRRTSIVSVRELQCTQNDE